MENDLIRNAINQYAIENDIEIVLLDNPCFDNSIVGVTDDKVIYDLEKMVEEYMTDEKCSYEDAYDFISYNTLRALPYFPNSPIILSETIENLLEKY